MAKLLIAGCGFLGLAAARLFHAAGREVIGVTHSAESAAALRGEAFPLIACDITNRAALTASFSDVEEVVHCASSGRGGADAYRTVYLEGAKAMTEALQPRRLLFVSSTSVFAQLDGSIVTEESAAEPDRETGRILRETEDFVNARGGVVARLAGIYGPGRSVLLKKFLSGEAVIEGDGTRWINQIHRDDAAAALVRLIEADARGTFNVADDEPLTQRALYAWLAAHFARRLPPTGPIDPNRKRGWTSKRVSNAKLRALGWAPRFPSFQSAVLNDPALLKGLDPRA